MNIIGNRKLTATIKGNIPELTVLPQIQLVFVMMNRSLIEKTTMVCTTVRERKELDRTKRGD